MTQISSHADGKPFLNPVRVIGWGLIAVLLSAPAVAMRFTHEVDWTAFATAYLFALAGRPSWGEPH